MPYKDSGSKLAAQKARRLKPLVEAPDKMKPLVEAPLDKISSVFKTAKGRQKLLDILAAFRDSNHPEYMDDVRLGVFGHTLRYISSLK